MILCVCNCKYLTFTLKVIVMEDITLFTLVIALLLCEKQILSHKYVCENEVCVITRQAHKRNFYIRNFKRRFIISFCLEL